MIKHLSRLEKVEREEKKIWKEEQKIEIAERKIEDQERHILKAEKSILSNLRKHPFLSFMVDTGLKERQLYYIRALFVRQNFSS